MTQLEQVTATAINSWKQVIGRIDQGLASASDDSLELEVAPGRNRVFYLLGHLTAVHDRLFSLLGLGERLHPELDKDFLEEPDHHAPNSFSPASLRTAWAEVNGKLIAAFESLRPEEWLERHTAVSEEDFAKDPTRNRLAVLLSRTNHASFHTGQIRLTQKS
jgi:uncharacterized damage-inducible protein DinB